MTQDFRLLQLTPGCQDAETKWRRREAEKLSSTTLVRNRLNVTSVGERKARRIAYSGIANKVQVFPRRHRYAISLCSLSLSVSGVFARSAVAKAFMQIAISLFAVCPESESLSLSRSVQCCLSTISYKAPLFNRTIIARRG